MTDLLLDPNDTGEIPAADTTAHIDLGETTRNLAPYMEHPPALRLAVTEPTAEISLPQTIAVIDEADTERLYTLGEVETAVMQRHLDAGFAAPIAAWGEPLPAPIPLPPDPPVPAPGKYVARHRARARWWTPLVEAYATVYARLWGER